MKRRDFFRLGMKKTAEVVIEEVEARVEQRARAWIRPPFALYELDFLLKCTRCGDCTEACPHGVLFPLPAKFGLEAVSTPAIDLMEKGCRLCDDWPCVTSCEPGALFRPIVNNASDGELDGESVEDGGGEGNTTLSGYGTMPKLAQVLINVKTCLPYLGPECGACAGSCPVEGALLWDGPKPHIDADICTGCALCREACIHDPKAILIRPVQTGA